MTPKELLAKARDLFANNANAWTQRAWARDQDNTPTGASDPNAKCFCLLGALQTLAPGEHNSELRVDAKNLLRAQLQQDHEYESVLRWNDTPGRTRDEVVGLLNRALNNNTQVTTL